MAVSFTLLLVAVVKVPHSSVVGYSHSRGDELVVLGVHGSPLLWIVYPGQDLWQSQRKASLARQVPLVSGLPCS